MTYSNTDRSSNNIAFIFGRGHHGTVKRRPTAAETPGSASDRAAIGARFESGVDGTCHWTFGRYHLQNARLV